VRTDTSSSQRREQGLVLLAAGTALCIVALAPLLRLLAETFSATSALSVLASSRPWMLPLRSIGLAATTTLLALGIGIPFGLLCARTDLAGRRVLWLLHSFPIFLPPFLFALGWFQLFGRGGSLGTVTTSTALFSATGRSRS
jgi:ABC-type Fe3+ transport system permease subunit